MERREWIGHSIREIKKKRERQREERLRQSERDILADSEGKNKAKKEE